MTVTKFRMTALAPTTKRGFVVGILASLKECRTNIIGAISLGRNQFPEGAKTRFIAPRTGSSNPFPSSGESTNHRSILSTRLVARSCARFSRPCLPKSCLGVSQRSPPRLLPAAACGGLRSAPDHRTRRALLHLSYSCAPQIIHGHTTQNRPLEDGWSERMPSMTIAIIVKEARVKGGRSPPDTLGYLYDFDPAAVPSAPRPCRLSSDSFARIAEDADRWTNGYREPATTSPRGSNSRCGYQGSPAVSRLSCTATKPPSSVPTALLISRPAKH